MTKLSSDLKNEHNFKIAYVHAMAFPNPEANTFDAIWTAAALSERVDTTFFIPMLNSPKLELRNYYEIPNESLLQIRSMYLNYLPDRVKSRYGRFYEQFLLLYFRFHPEWASFHGHKILYVREPKELLFWGFQRQQKKWLKDWIFCYEAHDHLGLDPKLFQGTNPNQLIDGPEKQRSAVVFQAASQFDLLICNTQALADDLRSFINNRVQIHFIRLASPLPRPTSPPKVCFGEKIVLGYIGTIDQLRGVNILLEAMRYLPQKYSLRLVGRLRQEKGMDPNWLDRYMKDPLIKDRVEVDNSLPIHDVAGQIDRCDILIQPASSDILDSKYVAPMKSYGYMRRAKPIVAADVPCHHEIYQDGGNAILYQLDPQGLADCIIKLVSHPELAERISRGAWEQGVDYNFPRRAEEILSLANTIVK